MDVITICLGLHVKHGHVKNAGAEQVQQGFQNQAGLDVVASTVGLPSLLRLEHDLLHSERVGQGLLEIEASG